MVETPYETKLVSLNYWQVTLIVTSDFYSDKWQVNDKWQVSDKWQVTS